MNPNTKTGEFSKKLQDIGVATRVSDQVRVEREEWKQASNEALARLDKIVDELAQIQSENPRKRD